MVDYKQIYYMYVNIQITNDVNQSIFCGTELPK